MSIEYYGPCNGGHLYTAANADLTKFANIVETVVGKPPCPVANPYPPTQALWVVSRDPVPHDVDAYSYYAARIAQNLPPQDVTTFGVDETGRLTGDVADVRVEGTPLSEGVTNAAIESHNAFAETVNGDPVGSASLPHEVPAVQFTATTEPQTIAPTVTTQTAPNSGTNTQTTTARASTGVSWIAVIIALALAFWLAREYL